MKLLMIGAGRMAEAIISGLLENNQDIEITVTNNTDEERLNEVARRFGIKAATDWRSFVNQSDVIISAAPPSAHETIFHQLAPLLNCQLVINVAAGVDISFMEEHLPEGTPVCWIMPNTAAQQQKSISTFVCGQHVDRNQRKIIEIILASIGDYEEFSEQQVHDLTAINGSAPAFFYLFCEALEEAATSYGVSQDQARKLVTQMVAGSAAMLQADNSPSDLREQVTTPGGSTAAGLKVLVDAQFKELLNKAVQATNSHARGKTN